MPKSPLPCRLCGKARDEVEFRYRRRYCVKCETADRECPGCKRTLPIAQFHNVKLCNQCRYQASAEYNRESARRRHRELRSKVFNAYGGECACCGERRVTMLCLDHIDEDGAQHRRALTKNWKSDFAHMNIGGTHIYADVVKRGFPPGFQLLCCNCNMSKTRNGGICEHQLEGATTISKESRAKRSEAPSTPRG